MSKGVKESHTTPELFHVLTMQLVQQVKVSPNKYQYSILVPLIYVKLC